MSQIALAADEDDWKTLTEMKNLGDPLWKMSDDERP
jgi:hypothetical protein